MWMEAPQYPFPHFSSSSRRQEPEGLLRHYYLAVDRHEFKMETLVDLLAFVSRNSPWLPIVVCCSSRDELDAVCASVSNLAYISLTSLYSDMADAERASIIDKFRQATVEWNRHTGDFIPVDIVETGKQGHVSYLMVVTDTCLPFLAAGETALSARVLINYELPTKKETYLRRISTCLAADGIAINMVVGGEVVILKGIEESSGLIITEMPINIPDIF